MARWSCAGPNTLTNSRAVRLDPSDNKILAVMMGVTHYKLTLRLAGVTRVTSSLVGVKSSIHLLIDSVLWAVNGGFGSRRIKFSVSCLPNTRSESSWILSAHRALDGKHRDYMP